MPYLLRATSRLRNIKLVMFISTDLYYPWLLVVACGDLIFPYCLYSLSGTPDSYFSCRTTRNPVYIFPCSHNHRLQSILIVPDSISGTEQVLSALVTHASILVDNSEHDCKKGHKQCVLSRRLDLSRGPCQSQAILWFWGILHISIFLCCICNFTYKYFLCCICKEYLERDSKFLLSCTRKYTVWIHTSAKP